MDTKAKAYLKKELERLNAEAYRLQVTITNKKAVVAKAKEIGFTKDKYKLVLHQKNVAVAVAKIKRLNTAKKKKSDRRLNPKENKKEIKTVKKGEGKCKWIYQGFKLPPKLVARLTKYAKKSDTTKTDVVKKALRFYLKKKGA